MFKYKFTIKYYYEKYSSGIFTGEINKDKIRIAIIYSNSLKYAKEKVKKIDDSFINIADNGIEIEELDAYQK